MMGQTLVFLVYVGAAIGLVILLGCVMTLASIAVGDPDPLAWAKETGRMLGDGHRPALPPYVSPYAHAQREYEQRRDEYQRSLRDEYQRSLKERG